MVVYLDKESDLSEGLRIVHGPFLVLLLDPSIADTNRFAAGFGKKDPLEAGGNVKPRFGQGPCLNLWLFRAATCGFCSPRGTESFSAISQRSFFGDLTHEGACSGKPHLDSQHQLPVVIRRNMGTL